MKTYHETAGRRPENTLAFKFDAEGLRSRFFLFDVYCENPSCDGWEISASLVALEPVKRTIAFQINCEQNRMTAEGDISEDDIAIAMEFCHSPATRFMLLRRRQLVRAWGLAQQGGRPGSKRRFTGDCYAFRDFDEQRESYVILFESAGETWSVMDQYCVAPRCPCCPPRP